MSKKLSDNIGNTDPKSPYCNHILDKKPAQKKKCPNCGNYMYVRTRPSDREKILVTETQIPLVERRWKYIMSRRKKKNSKATLNT